MQPVALFGGSFDPPHCGHAALVRAALELLSVGEVWVVPAARPVHRRLSGLASPMQKKQWLERMFADEPRVRVQTWELEAVDPVPTIETLHHFATLGRGVPLWLMGADAFAGMASWIDYPAHRALCNVAVFSRVGYRLPEMAGWQLCSVDAWRRHGHESPGHLLHLQVALPDVSATMIRNRAKRHQSLKGLVHETLHKEIETCYAQENR